jgi:hypothetical protein
MRRNKTHPQSLSCSNCLSILCKILVYVFTYSNDHRNCLSILSKILVYVFTYSNDHRNCLSILSKILVYVFTYSNDHRNCVTLIQQPYTHHKLTSSMNKNIPPANCENNSFLHQHDIIHCV